MGSSARWGEWGPGGGACSLRGAGPRAAPAAAAQEGAAALLGGAGKVGSDGERQGMREVPEPGPGGRGAGGGAGIPARLLLGLRRPRAQPQSPLSALLKRLPTVFIHSWPFN